MRHVEIQAALKKNDRRLWISQKRSHLLNKVLALIPYRFLLRPYKLREKSATAKKIASIRLRTFSSAGRIIAPMIVQRLEMIVLSSCRDRVITATTRGAAGDTAYRLESRRTNDSAATFCKQRAPYAAKNKYQDRAPTLTVIVSNV